MLRVVDTHAHLSDLNDVDAALQRAREKGLCAVVAVSANMSTCMDTMRIAEVYGGFVYPALGVHPTLIEDDYEDVLLYVKANINRCIAVGEIGLDFWRTREQPSKSEDERRLQVTVYTKQLEIAQRHSRPVLIHSRGAWDACYELAQSLGIKKALFHWFTGSVDTLKSILDEGYLVSATPAAEYSKALRAVIKDTPLDSLVLETDCPVTYHGKPSEPSDVLRALQAVAELKGIPEQEIAEATTLNAFRFFDFPSPR